MPSLLDRVRKHGLWGVWVSLAFLAAHATRVLVPLACQGKLVLPGGNLAKASGTLVILRPWLVPAMGWTVTLVACAVVVVAVRQWLARVALAGALLLVHGCSSVSYELAQTDGFTACSRARGRDGRTYAFLDHYFLQDQIMALGVLERSGAFADTYRVLGATNGDYPRSWASVVREEGSSDAYGQLRATPRGTLLGVRYDNHAFFAYSVESGAFAAGSDIERISPFVLLTADSVPSAADAGRLMTILRDAYPYRAGFPIVAHLARARSHPNERVREVARQALATLQARGIPETGVPPEPGEQQGTNDEGIDRPHDAEPIDDLDAWLATRGSSQSAR
jgi:hypothetical protein